MSSGGGGGGGVEEKAPDLGEPDDILGPSEDTIRDWDSGNLGASVGVVNEPLDRDVWISAVSVKVSAALNTVSVTNWYKSFLYHTRTRTRTHAHAHVPPPLPPPCCA